MSEVDKADKSEVKQLEARSRRSAVTDSIVVGGGWLSLAASLVLLLLFVLRPSESERSKIDVRWTTSATTSSPDSGETGNMLSLVPALDEISAGTPQEEELQQLIAAAKTAVPSDAAWDDELLNRLSQTGGATAQGLDRSVRWRFFFDEGLTQGDYARQLESIGFEIAMIGGPDEGEPKIHYISKLTEQVPETRVGDVDAEKRLYLSWRQGNLVGADEALLGKAGLITTGKVVVHFCSPELEKRLLDLERKFKNRQPYEVEFTQFGIRPAGDSFECYVRRQE